MSDVSFDEEVAASPTYSSIAGASGLSGMLMKYGIAKDYASAQKILLGIAVVALVLTFYISFMFLRSHVPPIPPPIPPSIGAPGT